MYAVITAFALYIFYKYVPDTSGYSLDEVEILFMTPDQREKHVSRLHTQMARRQSTAEAKDQPSTLDIGYTELSLEDGEDSGSLWVKLLLV